MKRIYLLFCFISLLFLLPETTMGQTALSIDQNEANFGTANERVYGWVRAVKQRFFEIAPKRYNDEMKKKSNTPIYQINVFYDKAGNTEYIEGPGLTTITNKHNAYGDLLMSDRIGDFDLKHYRRITNHVYDPNGRILEKTESNIPYTLSGNKVVFNLQKPDVRTRTEYRYNVSGQLSELIVYENQRELKVVYREQYLYDKLGLLSQKIASDRDGNISMREDYVYGVCSKTEFINNGKINRRIVYDKKGRPIEDTGIGYIEETTLGYGDIITTIKFKYDDSGKLVEWTAHDALGNLKQIYTGISTVPYCVKGTFQYDPQGNRIGWTFYDEQGVVVDRYFIQATYDKRGNWTRKAMVENVLGTDQFVIVERELVYY